MRVVQRAEPEWIPYGDRPRTHGEHISEDATHTGGGTLIRLHIARMVVALDSKRSKPPVTEVHDACVLSGANDHPGLVGREPPQMSAGRFVGAMLGPHDRVHRELCGHRLSPKDFDHVFVFHVSHAELDVRWRVCGHALTASSEATKPSISTMPSLDPRIDSDARSG